MNPPPTFEQAIPLANALIEAVETGKITDAESCAQLAALVSSTNGARGFFVALLTGNSPLAENLPSGFIDVFKAHPQIVCDLLTKNLVMSATMVVTHSRKGDETMAANSRAVNVKTKRIIKSLDIDTMAEHLIAMEDAIEHSLKNEEGEADQSLQYSSFLTRWRYDAEQLKLAVKCLAELGAEEVLL